MNAQLGDANLNLGRVHGAIGGSSRYIASAMDANEVKRNRDYAQMHQQMLDSNQNLINITNNINHLNTTMQDSNLGRLGPRAPVTPGGAVSDSERARRDFVNAEMERFRRRRSSGVTDVGSPGT